MSVELQPDEAVNENWTHEAVLPVAVMISSPGGDQARDSLLWQVTGVVVGAQFASDKRVGVCVRSGPGGDLFLWRGFTLRLRPSQAEDYALNLGGDRPEVFVIARFDKERGVEPLEVTVSLDRAQGLDSTDLRSSEEIVLSAPMPSEVGCWVDEFVSVHYQPRRRGGKGRGKRRSKAAYDAEVGDWGGDDA